MTNIYFSDFFGVEPECVEEYGAFDVSLVNDLPLFVDPFLLFNSSDPVYQRLHVEIIDYMRFLKNVTLSEEVSKPLVAHWFTFPEVRQNWLGFSRAGNRGHGLGKDFSIALHKNFNTVFRDFGQEELTRASHLEKLCLIRSGVGRDMISDFTANLIKDYLARYSEDFARRYLTARQRKRIALQKTKFNYQTRSWETNTYELPYIDGNYVLLTPKNILTKDETWINRTELINRFEDIAQALPDSVLRAQVNDYLSRALPRDPRATKEEISRAISETIEKFPKVLDYYISEKEEDGDRAVSVSKEKVHEVETLLVDHVRQFVSQYLEPGGFYANSGTTYEEARNRLLFLKDVIENKGGHKIFYVNGKPIEREADLQILYRLAWFGSPSDVSREVNDGRGPADFKISRGSGDKTIVEFKLAKNSQLERNLRNQSQLYEKASDATRPSLKSILYFTPDQLIKVQGILKRLQIENSPHVILIDAGAENKPSGSKA